MVRPAEAAVRQAEAEGLTLQPSDSNSGYRNVHKACRSQAEAKPFHAAVWRAGEKVRLGTFATAAEAALAYARTPEAQAQVANLKPAPLTAVEVVAQAAVEGLELETSSNAAGYKGVKLDHSRYQARVQRAGKEVNLGSFVTAEEAALAAARANARPDPPAASPYPAAKRATPPPKPPPAKHSRNSVAPGSLQPDSDSEDGISVEVVEVIELCEEDAEGEEDAEEDDGEEEDDDEDEEDEEEEEVEEAQEMGQADAAEAAVRQAEAEGLTLQPADSAAGYRSVRKATFRKNTRFQARVWRAGKQVHLGNFATAEEAALVYARTPEAQAEVANPKPAPLTAEEAVVQAAAEGLTLEPSSNAAGYNGVRADGFRHQAKVWRAGKVVHLGNFVTAQEAALTIARAGARNDPPAAAPRPAAAKRAALPQKPPPVKLDPEANSNAEEPTAAPTPASASTASVRLEVGQSVEACFGGRSYWFPGVVQHINEDGTLAIDYEDGDQEERVLRKHVRPPKAKARPPSPLASTSSGRPRTAPQRLDASLLMASSRSYRSAGEASTLEEEEDSEEELGEPATHTAEAADRKHAAEAAVRQAEAEGLTLHPSDNNATGYRGVFHCSSSSKQVMVKQFQAMVKRAGKNVYLGSFVTAEEAALAFARADARTDPPAASPDAAKRAAPPPLKPPPAKQPRHTPPPRPVQPVPLPQRDAPVPQASQKLKAAAAAVAPAPVLFVHKLALLKRELCITPATPAIPAVAEANQQMGITPSLGEPLGVQLDRLLAIIS
eukprot:scaffold17220_cov65-Phaeocystis_antarctica.AAC.5